jgi:predicted TIM-barrel fold metal-dependent hydrolase
VAAGHLARVRFGLPALRQQEDSIEDLVNLMSPEHGLFGSDYPHPEGMADPLHWAKEIGDLFPAADVRKMMGENMYGLLDLALPSA